MKDYKEMTRKEFDGAAEKFDDNDPSVYNLCRKEYPEILEELEKEEFQDVLDAGCGTGAILGLLQEQFPDKKFTGIDLSEKMIGVASKKGLKEVDFIVGDCEKLPFPDASFDAVLCSMSFHHYPHPERFFQNVGRVLRPGGRLILRDMTGPGFILWLANHVEIPLLNVLLKTGDVHMYSQNEIHILCEKSGLFMELFEQRKGLRMHCVCRKKNYM